MVRREKNKKSRISGGESQNGHFKNVQNQKVRWTFEKKYFLKNRNWGDPFFTVFCKSEWLWGWRWS